MATCGARCPPVAVGARARRSRSFSGTPRVNGQKGAQNARRPPTPRPASAAAGARRALLAFPDDHRDPSDRVGIHAAVGSAAVPVLTR